MAVLLQDEIETFENCFYSAPERIDLSYAQINAPELKDTSKDEMRELLMTLCDTLECQDPSGEKWHLAL